MAEKEGKGGPKRISEEMGGGGIGACEERIERQCGIGKMGVSAERGEGKRLFMYWGGGRFFWGHPGSSSPVGKALVKYLSEDLIFCFTTQS